MFQSRPALSYSEYTVTHVSEQPDFPPKLGCLCACISTQRVWTCYRLLTLNHERCRPLMFQRLDVMLSPRPLPISNAFLVLISFARLAMNCDCSLATIMQFQECSIVLWKQWAETSSISFTNYTVKCDYISWHWVLNCAGAHLYSWHQDVLTSLSFFRAGCSLKEWSRTYCNSGLSFPPLEWLLKMLIVEDFFFPEDKHETITRVLRAWWCHSTYHGAYASLRKTGVWCS